MRLWHQTLIPYLDRQRLLGQHRECAALRGAGWGRKHSTVDYVFTHDPAWLAAYHSLVMNEMKKRGYHPDKIWYNWDYRGKTLGEQKGWATDEGRMEAMSRVNWHKCIYPEHNDAYLKECLDILHSKGVDIEL